MDISYVFACHLVTNRDEAVAWYERLFGRPPTFLPNDHEAVWQTAPTASVYVLVDPERAGKGVMSLVVDSLDATLREVSERGLAWGPIEVIPGAGRKSVLVDPDGNTVSLIEIEASP